MPIHIAITRRVRPGREAEFQQALREFLQTSFAHGGVQGASMLTPPPGSDTREYGILRTFAYEKGATTFTPRRISRRGR
jgi:antibiotic biosynthesis monooxygenase (ABM) superfamily enzyme